MKIAVLISILIFVFQGCSFKSPENSWEYNSSSAFNSYTKNFLIDNENIASDELNRAIKYSKQSANLEQLARIYLGVCALNISVGKKDECKKYKEIEDLVSSKELESYYLMLQNSLKKEQISNLPKQYQEFSNYKNLKKYDLSFESIKGIQKPSSKFIAASLIKEKIDKIQVNYLIEKASFYGYKKVVLYWLDYLKKVENDMEEKKRISKKIMILKSK